MSENKSRLRIFFNEKIITRSAYLAVKVLTTDVFYIIRYMPLIQFTFVFI